MAQSSATMSGYALAQHWGMKPERAASDRGTGGRSLARATHCRCECSDIAGWNWGDSDMRDYLASGWNTGDCAWVCLCSVVRGRDQRLFDWSMRVWGGQEGAGCHSDRIYCRRRMTFYKRDLTTTAAARRSHTAAANHSHYPRCILPNIHYFHQMAAAIPAATTAARTDTARDLAFSVDAAFPAAPRDDASRPPRITNAPRDG